MDKKQLIKNYCEALNQGRAAIFAGAGLSVGAGFVTWSKLLEDAAKELNYPLDGNTDLPLLAQFYFNEKKSNTYLFKIIQKFFPTSVQPTVNHKILASLPIKTYWTTNYDHLIEDALRDEGKKYEAKVTPESVSVSSGESDAIVYKMHGDIVDTTKCVLTRDNFEDYSETHKAYLDNFTYDLRNKTFLFLGLSFDDPNIKYVLGYVRRLTKGNPNEHYYILKAVSKESGESDDAFKQRQKAQELFVDDLKNYDVQTCFINDYKEITEVLSVIKSGYQRRSVFLSGAATFYDPFQKDDVNTFIRNLSAALIHEGFRIVNGYGLGFGNEVIAGALGQLQIDNKPVDGNLLIRPFPQGDRKLKVYWTKLRQDMISHTGISIFLFGNKADKTTGKRIPSNGMQEEYDISKAQGNFLIPVGATGDMSKILCDVQLAEITKSPSPLSPAVDELNALNDNTKSFDELKQIIINIVKRVQL